MKDYELNNEEIISWAVSYASFEDLETVAKALYGIYVQRRKNDHPEIHKANRKLRRKLTNTGEFRKPKKDKWANKKASAERQLALNAKRLGAD